MHRSIGCGFEVMHAAQSWLKSLVFVAGAGAGAAAAAGAQRQATGPIAVRSRLAHNYLPVYLCSLLCSREAQDGLAPSGMNLSMVMPSLAASCQ